MKNEIIVLGNIYDEDNRSYQAGRVYHIKGICATIAASNFGATKFILIKDKIKRNIKYE